MEIKFDTDKWIEVQDEIQVFLIRENRQARDWKLIERKINKDKSWVILPVFYVQNVARIVLDVCTVHFLKN